MSEHSCDNYEPSVPQEKTKYFLMEFPGYDIKDGEGLEVLRNRASLTDLNEPDYEVTFKRVTGLIAMYNENPAQFKEAPIYTLLALTGLRIYIATGDYDSVIQARTYTRLENENVEDAGSVIKQDTLRILREWTIEMLAEKGIIIFGDVDEELYMENKSE